METVLKSEVFILKVIKIMMGITIMGMHITGLAQEIERAVGWHWYNETPLKTDKEKEINKEEEKASSAVAQMTQLRQAVEEAKARAILYPTIANMRSYLILQNFVTNQASLFTQAWKRTLLVHPELDYSILHPTQNSAQSLLYAQTSSKENEAIAAYSKKYGMFFFYRGNEALDQELAKTIDDFSKQHKISLIPISMDGRPIELFRKNQLNQGQAEQLGVKYFPALILVEPKSRRIVPLNYGFISESGLRRRFLQVATNFKDGV